MCGWDAAACKKLPRVFNNKDRSRMLQFILGLGHHILRRRLISSRLVSVSVQVCVFLCTSSFVSLCFYFHCFHVYLFHLLKLWEAKSRLAKNIFHVMRWTSAWWKSFTRYLFVLNGAVQCHSHVILVGFCTRLDSIPIILIINIPKKSHITCGLYSLSSTSYMSANSKPSMHSASWVRGHFYCL